MKFLDRWTVSIKGINCFRVLVRHACANVAVQCRMNVYYTATMAIGMLHVDSICTESVDYIATAFYHRYSQIQWTFASSSDQGRCWNYWKHSCWKVDKLLRFMLSVWNNPLSLFSSPHYLNALDKYGCSPLMTAAKTNQKKWGTKL